VTDPAVPGRSPVEEHKAHAPTRVRCVVCTVSDSKTPETDTSGRLIRELLVAAGHEVVGHHLVKDEPSQVHAVIHQACAHPSAQVLILTGGTGIAPRDQTFEAIEAKAQSPITLNEANLLGADGQSIENQLASPLRLAATNR